MPETNVAAEITAFFGISSWSDDGADLGKVGKLAAAIDSANFLNTEMAGCERFNHAFDLLTAAMQKRTVENGLTLEFGVFSGSTINHIAAQDKGPIFGFDSFEGLPEDWRPSVPKDSFRTLAVPPVAANVTLVVGWFDRTLPGFVEQHRENIAFLHVDCDLYSSTKTVFEFLGDRIVPGTVIVFDEFFNYVGWRNHEFKAFREFIAERGLGCIYFGAVPSHQQVGVVIT